ncbi:MAG TPA: protein kinase, partial [Myxococcaceae bacterium]
GRRISKYEILTRLSVGGMAELFLAYTSGPGGFRKFVALKQILPDVKSVEFVKMFLDEARITAAFSHANIGQVFDLGEEDGELYLAMEFLAGQNLEQLMKASNKLGEPLPPGFAARVIRDVCLGLHYAHHFVDPTGKAVAIVHRDMSPRNVMVTYDGGVKVIDFGIAKAKGRLGRTAVGMVKGTGGYMSPEQVRNRELDGRSDLFSSGVLLYEMLTGRRLFNAAGDAAMMLQIVEGEIPLPRSVNPNIPEALEAVVMKALARELPKRFASGREMAKAIEQAMGQELFDEERMAALMDELFAEKRQKTRALLEYANRDDARISEAAGALQEDVGESLLGVGLKGTPKPRSGAAAGPRLSTSGRVRKPGSDPSQSATPNTARIPRTKVPSRQDMPVAPPYQAPSRAAEEEEGATTAPSMQPLQSRTGRSAPKRPSTSTPSVRPSARTKTPAEAPAVEAKAEGEKSGWMGKLVLLAIVAGVGGLLYLEPVRALFKPGYESAVAWVKTEMDLNPPPPTEEKPWPPPPPPGSRNPLDQREQPEPTPPPAQAEATPEPTPTEPEPTEPEPTEPPEKPGATAAKPGTSTAKPGTSRPKSTEKTPSAQVAKADPTKSAPGTPSPAGTPGTAPTLEEQVAAQPQTTLEVDPSGEAVVLDTSSPKAMKKAGIGLLTLATVPPAAVFDGQTSLGTTPLTKVPLQAGTYKLRIVDPDGVSRLFSAPVGLAKESKYRIKVSDLPLYPE